VLLRLATVLGLTGCSYVPDPAVSDTPYLRPRQTPTKIMRPFRLGLASLS